MARKTLEDANAIDSALRELAHNQKELSETDNQTLHQILINLHDLGALRIFLAALTSQETLPYLDFTHFQRMPYTWEALAKARATSSVRHGFLFFERTDEVLLKELEERDVLIRGETQKLKGMVVARLLEPRIGSGKDLRIQIKTLISIPAEQVPNLPKTFVAVTNPSNPAP